MNLKSTIILAAALSLVAGGALAADDKNSQRYNKNKSTKSHKVQSSSDEFARTVDLNYEKKQFEKTHPIHQKRMGGDR